MAKVKDLFGEHRRIVVNPLDLDAIDPHKLWVHYDPEADSLVIYLTGVPVRAVSVEQGDDTYMKVNPANGQIVGFHVEAWARKFLPAHPDLQAVWCKMQPDQATTPDWSQVFRMLALWLIFIFKAENIASPTPHLISA